MKEFGTAVILAGGSSSRMGFDKQLLTINDRYIFERNVSELSTLFEDILVVTNTPELYADCHVRTTSDIYRNAGPLAGLHAALHEADSRYIYMVACDMPVMNIAFAGLLRDRLAEAPQKPMVYAPETDGRIQTFNAFYSTDLIPFLERELEACAGTGKTTGIHGLIKKNGISRSVLDEASVRAVDPSLSLFINLNTPEEYEKYKTRFCER